MKLTSIIIPDYLAESVPNEAKMNRAKRYFIEHGELDKPIIINHKKELVDGYIRYLILKEFDVEDIKQYRYEYERENKVVTYIYGRHPNQQSDKEYVWRVPTSEKWRMFVENISVGDIVMCYTKCGVKPVIISRIIRSDFRPMDIPENIKIKRIAKNQRGAKYGKDM